MESSRSQASLITDRDAVSPGQKFTFGLFLKLKPGWHTYWRNPGEAGEAPSFSAAFADGAVLKEPVSWSPPRVFSESGLVTYGYGTGSEEAGQAGASGPGRSDILFPFRVAAPEALGSGSAQLHLKASWLVCAKLCVPEGAEFTLEIPVRQGAETSMSPQHTRFEEHDRTLARPFPGEAAFVSLPEGSYRLILAFSDKGKIPVVEGAYFYPDQAGAIQPADPEPFRQSGHRFTLELMGEKGFSARPAALSGIVELRQKNAAPVYFSLTAPFKGAEKGAVSRTVDGAEPGGSVFGGIALLAAAFAGGLILNFMPCVFPVLAMKALSFARMGQAGKKERFISVFLTASGMVGSFAAIGSLLLFFRAGGQAAGWGFQFQSPLFVLLVCWLLFAMSLNLLGMFQIAPGAGRFSPDTDANANTGRARWEDFLTGLLAVVVASPCTAPFMGAAVAASLRANLLFSWLLFAFIGLGMAAPYMLLACFPVFSRVLPRPGAWMENFRELLAFPLLASCLWLLWVLCSQGGADALFAALAGLLCLTFGFWAFGKAQRNFWSGGSGKSLWPWRVAALAGFALAVSSAIFVRKIPAPSSVPPDAGAVQGFWRPFSSLRLERELEAGHPVFVDVSARWCLTCLVNDRLVLNQDRSRALFRKNGVIPLRGDWTAEDPQISAYLAGFRRDGVPFYVFYPARMRVRHLSPVILPQILTPSGIEKIIRESAEARD